MKRIYIVGAVTVLFSLGSYGQLFTDQGLFSGSGLTVVPTATVVPPSEFRLQVSRVQHVQDTELGINVIGVGYGLSSTLEGYVRLTGEQFGSAFSQVGYSFGGKFRVPMLIPGIRRLAFWVESTNSDMYQQPAAYPTEAFRYGAIATFDSNGIHPSLLLGLARLNNKTRPLIGAGVTYAVSQRSQIGFEVAYGYLNSTSVQIIASGATRVFKNISVHFSPGYVSSLATSSWMLSMGISFSTTDIDFHPKTEVAPLDEFQLPSFEEIEKQSIEEKKNE
ncbi:MAG: hypothetical protein EPO24_16190 [Bacteroidetes bacterium]|nr:MAG: hypothetical protein EPO24_16190 [Bacteroidota bacterium]